MPDVLFNDIVALFKYQLPAEAIRQFRLSLAERGEQEPASQLAVIADPEHEQGNDPVLEAMRLYIASSPAPAVYCSSPFQCLAAIAARLGLLSRIMAISWQHLSARTSFGIRTTKHQLIKAEFADISNQIDFMVMQWQLRIAENDFAAAEEDHWQIGVLTNRAEKLMGGHGYLLGNTHSLSYLSVMIYSLYGKTADADTFSRRENGEHVA